MTIDHSYTRHACLRLDQAADAAAGLRIAVEDMNGHLWAGRRDQLARTIADLTVVLSIIDRRIADEPVIIPRAA